MSTKSANESGYDQWSSTYDTGLNSTVYVDDQAFPPLWKEVVRKRVLEIGCGTGRHTTRLLDQQNRVVGVDLSQGMLQIAERRTTGRPIRLMKGDVLQLDASAITEGVLFDAAVSALVLEHIHDLDAFFNKVGSLLLEGAPLFISEIHPLRAKAGRLAHFPDAKSGKEVWLDSTAHAAEKVEASALAAGFTAVRSLDALGPESLPSLKPDWEKYVGAPMVKLWELKWRA